MSRVCQPLTSIIYVQSRGRATRMRVKGGEGGIGARHGTYTHSVAVSLIF